MKLIQNFEIVDDGTFYYSMDPGYMLYKRRKKEDRRFWKRIQAYV